MASEPRERPKLIQKLDARRADHIQRGIFYRIVFAVAGAIVLIPIGLAMLSFEFAWAERMLDRSLEQAAVAREKAAQTSRRQRIFGVVAGVLGVAAAVAAALVWDIPFLPV